MRQLVPFVALAVVVLAGVVGAFMLTGSPQHQRELAFDRKRIELIEQMSIAISGRYHGNSPAALPADVIKRDPETDRPFEYRRVSAKKYQLCGRFDQPSDDDPTYDLHHGSGDHCFDFTS